MQEIKPGKYMHYKGIECDVLGMAKHSEDPSQEFVVYSHTDSTGESQMWIRPKEMFFQEVEINGKKVPRFVYVGK